MLSSRIANPRHQVLFKKGLIQVIHTNNRIIYATIFVFIIGFILVIFKNKQQFWYGIIETIFSLVSCKFVLDSITTELKNINILIVIASSLYIIVRGLTNINDGVKKDFWLRSEIQAISNNSKELSQTKIKFKHMIRDKEFLIKILDRIASLITKLY